MSFKVGDTVGDYEIVGVLGAGGMGQVYKVRNLLSDRLEAMKVLLPNMLESPDQAERFLREIRLQASLDHPNIAALHTALRQGDQLVMIMELVEGTTLQTLLEKRPLRLPEAIAYASQALSALSYAHERGVIHRDIKPANILLTREGTIKITDFGIARLARDRKLTASGITMGSICYMSPEQVMGKADIDTRSDLYSLGVTLYECVAGRRPFQGESDFATMSAHLNQAPVPPLEIRPDLPPELNRIILKALAKEPSERFQSATAFGEELLSIPGFSEGDVAAKRLATADLEPPRPARETALLPSAPHSGSAGPGSTPNLEMAYVLFMDLVSYSTLPMDVQSQRIQLLQEIVRNTSEYRRAQQVDQIISLPTGDGMALVFFQNPVAPMQCAQEISRSLRNYPELKLRMGVHTGPVYRIADINTNRNVAGGGINLAQRVMDCGDAGHILVSKPVADVLSQLSDWAGHLHDFGECEVKHGVKVQLVNFCTGEVGNSELPQKLRQTKSAAVASSPPVPAVSPAGSRRNLYLLAGGLVAVLLIVFGAMQFSRNRQGGEPQNAVLPATLGPSQPPPASSPPPPSVPLSAEPPAGLAPPPPSAVLPPPRPTAVAPQPTPAPEVQRDTAEPAARVAPQERTEPPPAAAVPAQGTQGAPSAADRALLQEQRERMILLAGRAEAVRSTLETMELQQRRAGLSMRRDMAAAAQSMRFLMKEAATATRNLDLAEQNLERVERFLGR